VGEDFSAERMADAFINYLYDNYKGNRHVRRVAAWFGFLVFGIEQIKETWWLPRSRQLFFESKGRRYKVKYNHTIKPRGGIEIVEVAAEKGSPEIRTVLSISSMNDAARFYGRPNLA
jgi:hypothetical protein